ncbi:hypothetical protein JH06_2219 [Blastocystis sp. subtype 4]|uniref:hypothetical protein n=1 Tax=Blastocystis sp. subtype 4 TaxID=944170 RepID=UPI0007118E5B|nr:hypothetical protein JH06_2219 [Blastocystis sp. subtype 4]KNB43855.1 hypothetical protein JH06_2219 [Blastocystis sp. subtype 4]|eukprot:XP_014527298.1 hypothetical protein JH06_2219 [Blastocystis sp. subtype 4]
MAIRAMKAIVNSEVSKRKTMESLRYSERVGRVRAEKELRKVIEGQRKEEDGDGYVFNPIGFARSCYVHCQGVPRQPGLVPNARSRIEIEEWVPPPAFDDLTQFSHIWVLFVFHMNTNLSTLHRSITEKGFTFPAKVRPPRLGGKSTGLFATRTPHRPCPIGLSVVKLEEVHVWGKKRYLVISNTDIVDGSPILDIKPYHPGFDRIDNAVVPE